MERNYRVLHINSYYAVSPFYKNLYDEQKRAGIDIDVYVPVNKKWTSKNRDFGDYSKVSKVFSSFDRALFFRKHRKILTDIKKHYDIENYDLIHAHSLFSNGYIALKLYREFGIPYIVAVRNTDVNLFFKYMVHLRSLGREIIKNAQKVIFISEIYKENVTKKYFLNKQETFSKQCVVIPNGIHDFCFNNLFVKDDYTPSKNIKILAVGNVDKNKNHSTTLKACESLQKEGYKVEFNIVGRARNHKILNTLSNSELVNYMGTMHKEQLIKVYRENDVFVMPSFTETFGLVYAEAMSQGLPVIYSKNQGFDGQFPEGIVGYHTESDDYIAIKNCIKDILSRYDYFSNQCTANIGKFNWGNISKQYMMVYREAKKGAMK